MTISYGIEDERLDYVPLRCALLSLGTGVSTGRCSWETFTVHSVQEVVSHLRPHLRPGDFLVVTNGSERAHVGLDSEQTDSLALIDALRVAAGRDRSVTEFDRGRTHTRYSA